MSLIRLTIKQNMERNSKSVLAGKHGGSSRHFECEFSDTQASTVGLMQCVILAAIAYIDKYRSTFLVSKLGLPNNRKLFHHNCTFTNHYANNFAYYKYKSPHFQPKPGLPNNHKLFHHNCTFTNHYANNSAYYKYKSPHFQPKPGSPNNRKLFHHIGTFASNSVNTFNL